MALLEYPIKDNEGKVIFTAKELASSDTGEVDLEPTFYDRIKVLRNVYNRPMYVTSCCRTMAHNIEVGGHPRSLHLISNHAWRGHKGKNLKTCAMDIRMPMGTDLHRFMYQALSLSFSIGLNRQRNFVHIDLRTAVLNKDPKVFIYLS